MLEEVVTSLPPNILSSGVHQRLHAKSGERAHLGPPHAGQGTPAGVMGGAARAAGSPRPVTPRKLQAAASTTEGLRSGLQELVRVHEDKELADGPRNVLRKV